MLISALAKKIQDSLHEIAESLGYDVTFIITDNRQLYNDLIETKDGATYNVGVLHMVGNPFTFNTLDIKVTSYRIDFWGLTDQLRQIEKIIDIYHNQKPMYDNHQIMMSKLFVDDFGYSMDGENQARFNAYVNIDDNEMPYTANGLETEIRIDDVMIPFNTVRFRKDKSLIPNVAFGNSNTSVKLISETMQLEIPAIVESTKIMGLLADTLNDTYNKIYTVKWELGTISKTVDMVFRVGTVEYNRNGQPITFWITLERALTRKDFKIDDITIPVLKWSLNGNAEITSISKSDGIKSKIIGNGRVVTALLLNDGSAKINEIIQNINNHDKLKRFNVTFTINNITFTYPMIIKDGSIQVTEHPDLMVECTFIEGVV